MTEAERAEWLNRQLFEAGFTNAVVMFEVPSEDGGTEHGMTMLGSPMAAMGLARWANAYLEELVTEEIEVTVYDWDGDDD